MRFESQVERGAPVRRVRLPIQTTCPAWAGAQLIRDDHRASPLVLLRIHPEDLAQGKPYALVRALADHDICFVKPGIAGINVAPVREPGAYGPQAESMAEIVSE